jgi:hypothetical protein
LYFASDMLTGTLGSFFYSVLLLMVKILEHQNLGSNMYKPNVNMFPKMGSYISIWRPCRLWITSFVVDLKGDISIFLPKSV